METCIDESIAIVASGVANPKVYTARKELEKFLRSQHSDPGFGTSFAASRYLFVCNDQGFKLIEMDERLQETVKFNRMADLISRTSFVKVSSKDSF